MVSNIASYFARTENASNSVAAVHIIPAPVGNAIGALVAGKIISRYVSHDQYSWSSDIVLCRTKSCQ